MNIEHELAAIQLDVDQNLEDQYLKLDNRLAIMCRIQNCSNILICSILVFDLLRDN